MSASATLVKALASRMVDKPGLRWFHVSLCGVRCSSLSRKLAVAVRVDARTESVFFKFVSIWVYIVFLFSSGGCVSMSLVFSSKYGNVWCEVERVLLRWSVTVM